ncbi:MAG: hypothetical protein V2A76_07400 [Planctomycetota bacterium]
MLKFAFIVLSLGLFALPATAQKMGMINRNAPAIEQKMDLGSTGTVSLKYTGITWGAGAWAKALEDEGKRDQARQRINQTADKSPLGSFECSKDVQIDDVLVPAGKYDLAFKLDDDFAWQIALAKEGSSISIPLTLTQAEEASKRLVVSVYAGDEDFTGGLYVAFGMDSGMLSITPAPEEDQR